MINASLLVNASEGHWLNQFNPKKSLFRGRAYLIVKRIMDLALVILSLPLTLPVMGLCALMLKLESPHAPIFFKQLRTGKGGRPFRMFKFRTMVVNAEQLKGQLAALNTVGELAGPLKLKDDQRVTRVGRLLRKTSLDELPQIFNVLKGEMSLVGPRPTSWSATFYKLWQTERLDVLPGITGLWQVVGRGSDDFDQWLRFDITYIERRCLWLDIQILTRTVTAVLEERGAY